MFPAELFNDERFRRLDDGPQRLLMWLWVHPDLNGAGVIAIQPREWASAAANLTADLIEDYAKQLRVEGWVDYDDGQLWIKPFMLLDGVLKSPSGYISAARAVKTIRSRRLRNAVWQLFEAFGKPTAPMPEQKKDESEGDYAKRVKRAAGLNASVETAWAETQRSISNPGVLESLSGAVGMHLPMGHRMELQMRPPMGRVDVEADDDVGVDQQEPRQNGESKADVAANGFGLCSQGCDSPAGHGSRNHLCEECARTVTW
ncbi:hypothetical protein ACJH6J_27210 [Mycobacterium sp. SMC-18]|uniref:hypothetical protein n=1 Tax=Mycobacteriaceae TaxID=1762 RepID=UPI001BB40B03|nr:MULTISPECIES: hypothetical protein [unclassified Mycolicibacterium]BCI83586.1 hypothetical protein MTY66_52110 [Mycolicibacterium sp. TY66]